MEIKRCIIAGLKVELRLCASRTARQAEPYLADYQGDPDIVVDVSEEEVRRAMADYPSLSFDDMEYVITGSRFYYRFLSFGGFMLHSSCVVADDGKAYLFSAVPGTGKSTHTALWCRYLKDKAFILNDDKPAVRQENGVFYAYGTPWSGKTDQNVNARYPIGGIAFIERSDTNFIQPMASEPAILNFYWQTVKPRNEEKADLLFGNLEKLLSDIPVWQFGCDISEDAFKTSYETMTGRTYEKK